MNKRGTHVSIIVSFTIFILFLSFIYTIIQPPILQKQSKQYAIDYLRNYIISQTSVNLTSIVIALNESYIPGELCVSISNPIDASGQNIIIKDDSNRKINYDLEGNSIEFMWNYPKFIKIFYSKEFSTGESPLSECASALENRDYFLGHVKKSEYIFESKIEELISTYNEFREEVAAEAGGDFGFALLDENKEELYSTGEVDVSTNTYYEAIPIQFVDKEANLRQGYLLIKTW